jgi:hypothetical protein
LDNLAYSVFSSLVLSAKPCDRYLENDGISSRLFLLRDYYNKNILIKSNDVNKLKNDVPLMGKALTIIKNLDQYQFIMCNYIPGLSDNSYFKIKFQKIRILIHLFFINLSKIFSVMNKGTASKLEKWNVMGNNLLVETSEIILEYRESQSNPKSDGIGGGGDGAKDQKGFDPGRFAQKIKLSKDYFKYFGIDDKSIDSLLLSTYGIRLD